MQRGTAVESTASGELSADRLLTIRQTATVLMQSISSVRGLVSRGELPAVKLGRSVRIRQSELEDFMRNLPAR